jgi:ribonuclease HI
LASGNRGIGVVFRDHHGSFHAGACCFLTDVADSKRAEILGCTRAAEIALDTGAAKVCLEMDCMGAVAKLNLSGTNRSIHGPLIEDIKFLLMGFTDFSVKHVRRVQVIELHIFS